MKICNLHDLRFEEGKDKIITDLNNCIQTGVTNIQFIHGYHGHAFKDYIQSLQFIQEMEEEGIFLSQTGIHSKGGMTEFRIDNITEINTTPIQNEIKPDLIDSNHPNSKKKMSLEEAKAFFGD